MFLEADADAVYAHYIILITCVGKEKEMSNGGQNKINFKQTFSYLYIIR